MLLNCCVAFAAQRVCNANQKRLAQNITLHEDGSKKHSGFGFTSIFRFGFASISISIHRLHTHTHIRVFAWSSFIVLSEETCAVVIHIQFVKLWPKVCLYTILTKY